MRINSSDVGLSSRTRYQQEQKITTNYLDTEERIKYKKIEKSSIEELTTASARNMNYGNGMKSVSRNTSNSINNHEKKMESANLSKRIMPDYSKRNFVMEGWLKNIFNDLSSALTEMAENVKNFSPLNPSILDISPFEVGQRDKTLEKLFSINERLSETLDRQLRFMGGLSEMGRPMSFTPQNNREKIVEIEYEQNMMVESKGKVITDDGKEIQFNLNIASTQKGESKTITRYQVMDPLVINFEGKAAELKDMRFAFDLDSDGKDDAVPYLNKGSGFLAFDANEDGKINDGSELFGTKSGNGFTDLAEFDEDGNMWIDENDAIFNELSVWMQNDENGEGKLLSLYEAGVGAIHLGNVETNAKIFGSQGQILGFIGQSGVALSEEGSAYNVQSLDIVV